MRFLFFILLFPLSLNAETLFDCAPKSGQLLQNNSQYISYYLEAYSPQPLMLSFRKGFQGLADEYFVDKLMPKAGFLFK